ncbi:hypothetical protein L596_010136 [Steinernema carpocapsae]|uniref:Uncharacterized protein n=1 Tax=Steinernema carpocapsae TaxID=34508 RepID=A0A4U5PHF3_STECR|nr:hypothetical protein L596_010136 [Steinernema carpocapsae]
MGVLRFAALLALFVFSFPAIQANTILEIDRLSYDVLGALRTRPDALDSYTLRFCFNNSLVCKENHFFDLERNEPHGLVRFEEGDCSWFGYHLNVSLISSSGDYRLMSSLSPFRRHEWTQTTLREENNPYFEVSFRHRFVCKEGFGGAKCDHRLNPITPKEAQEPFKPPPAPVTPNPSTSQSQSLFFLTQSFLLLLLVVSLFTLLIFISLCFFLAYRKQKAHQYKTEIDPEKVSISTISSTVSLNSRPEIQVETVDEEYCRSGQ